MTEHLLEIKIAQPGRTTGQYFSPDSNTLRLEKIIYPSESIPFDVGILPTALTSFDEPFAVLVLGTLSHPMHTEIESRLLGALQRGHEDPLLVVVPVADERALQSLDGITAGQRAELVKVLSRTRPGQWRWLIAEEVEPHLHAAALRYRQMQASGKRLSLDPAWQPIHVSRPPASFAAAEHYTAAEYTFYELPYRFQHYVSEYLAPDERILYAARRPAMPSQRKGSWPRRQHLQAGVLILTTQRLIHLAELVRPDSGNIRYGFHTSIGVLERLEGISVSTLGDRSLVLSTTWGARGGHDQLAWEMPIQSRHSLDELIALLEKFIASAPAACQLRRAALPHPPDQLPPLTDTASNDPQGLLLVNQQFSAALAKSLAPGEKAYAWAFLPHWFNPKKGPQALVVTGRRIFSLPHHSFEIVLPQIPTLEYTSSILESSLVLNYIENGSSRRKVVLFPYPAAHSFRGCFEAARRCMAVVPSYESFLHTKQERKS